MYTVMSRSRQKFDLHEFNHKKPYDMGDIEQLQLKFSNSVAS
jgi:hypothetical protein